MVTSKNFIELLEKSKSVLKGDIKHLQMIPATAITLLKLNNDENTTAADLSLVIETEPALAAQFLELVNSTAYGLPAQISSIDQAIDLLGFTEVKQVSLNLLFFNHLIKPCNKVQFDQLHFWQHCLFVANLSRSIAVSVNHPDPDTIYVSGLLHDIGKFIFETHGLVTYSDFLDFFKKSDNAISENEKTFFSMTHAEISYVLCEQWQLPASITAMITLHHTDFSNDPLAAGCETGIAIVSFANFIAWMQGIGSVHGNNHPVLQMDVLNTLDVEQLDIEQILDHVDDEMRNIQKFYGIHFPSLHKLRATLVKTTINLSTLGAQGGKVCDLSEKNTFFLSSLTAPHHSLDPDDFVPRTLEAIQNNFGFDRVMTLDINPKRRSLVASYCYPPEILDNQSALPEIMIGSASTDLLTCLRQREAVLITNTSWLQCKILKQQDVKEFFAVPILRHHRFIGIIYVDNAISQKELTPDMLHQIVPIANELGIALNNAKQLELEKKRALTDSLTSLNNRRMLDQFLENIYQDDMSKYGQIAIGFIDIDHFKRLNDECGHQAGDDALKVVADIMRSLTRPNDCIGRYGGEEFLFIHLNTTVDGVTGYAERIRAEVEKRGKVLSRRITCDSLTVSIGVVMHDSQYHNYYDIIDAADKAMYRAKKEGRNRVVFEG